MRVVFLTQYFPPETGAPQNRLYDLARRISQSGIDITIMTAMPNYPAMEIHKGYKGKFFCREEIDGLEVLRSWIFVRNARKNMVFRLLNYISFSVTSFLVGLFKLKKFDVIFCESPPLFLGLTSYLLKAMKGGAMIFNISDLWPESAERLGLVTNRRLLGMARKLEEFLYRKSDIITGQTQGIVGNISRRIPDREVYWLKNGVDLSFFNEGKIDLDWRGRVGLSPDDFIIMYAGIHGFAQGLDTVIEAAGMLKDMQHVRFVFVGQGPVKEKLQNSAEDLKLSNLTFVDPQPREMMPSVIAACDAGLVPLRKLDLFKGAIPSKVFEFLAMRKPVLLGVDGEARGILIDDSHSGLFFEPENAADLSEKVRQLVEMGDRGKSLGENGYRLAQSKFDRRKIAADFMVILNRAKSKTI